MVLKTKEEAKANFEAAIAYIPARYEAGIKKADWQTPAASDEAEANFRAAMEQALAEKRRQKAVASVSNTEWQNAAITKGRPIIGDRIRSALDKWMSNWGPIYDQVVTTVQGLKPRTLDWRENINQRLVPVVEAWKKAAGKL